MDSVQALAERIRRARLERGATCPADAEMFAMLGPTRSPPQPGTAVPVRLVGWERGFLKVSAVRLIHHFTGLGLAESVIPMNEVLHRRAVVLEVARQDAETFRLLLRAIGTEVDA